ncbi:MAG TPA: HNH endonuclease signature motif containing protein [Kofleriaceae bacterium]|nr:HNH endonuclease signature motif containing protein [Kofleriaceae bacterium]
MLHYAPRTAHDRLRVARALGSLPALTGALSHGDLSFSAVRELTRVATPATEARWLAAAAGKNLREIEDLVADRRPGDQPDDPPDPEARTHVVRFELAAQTFALLRQARTTLDEEHGTNLPDDRFVAALCNAVLDGTSQAAPSGRAKFQIAMTVCQRCRGGWQAGAGVQVPVDATVVERALCDALHIGSLDGAAPERAHQDIPPSVARFVWHRDHGRCRVPGCRSARGLEIRHVVHRAHGGSHDASNLVLCCSSCHQSHHAGVLTISGTADQLEVGRPGHLAAAADDARNHAPPIVPTSAHAGTADAATRTDAPAFADRTAHVGTASLAAPVADLTAHVGTTSRLNATILRTQARAALTGLGWKPAIASAAVSAAAAAQGSEFTLERLIFESLRRCPVPNA